MRSLLVITCFFLSGVAALILEICWIRKASIVFGSTTAALSTVLSVFFGGLALGSVLFGRASQRTTRPLRLFVGLEIAVAAASLCTIPLLALVDGAYGAAYRAFGEGSAMLAIVRIGLTALVLLPPTVLMGGTLPLLCRHFVQPGTRIAGRVGFLYGFNTLGAACGCALAGLVLVPGIGVTKSIMLAACLDLVAGAGVLLLKAPARPGDDAPPAPVTLRGSWTPHRLLVAALFFGTGLVALGIEVVWTRHLALIIHNTVYTYTITLTVVLVGIVVGSWLAALVFDRGVHRALSFAVLQILTAWGILIVLRLPPETWRVLESEVAVAFCLLLPGAILSGAAFPLAVRMVLDDPDQAGLGVGVMSAVNTVGGITGAALAGFVLLPLLGLDRSALVLSAVSVVVAIGALGLAWPSLPAPRGRAIAAVAGVLALAGWVVLPWRFDTRVPEAFLGTGGTLVDYREGRVANLAVVEAHGIRELEIDRLWQGNDQRNHQAMAAHIPALLHPDPKAVLVVGVGTGQTPARFLMHPIERLDTVDIEPRLYDFIRGHFDAAWMDDPRANLLGQDGRNHVMHTADTYDIISMEVGQLFRPGIETFYTVDFYRAAADRLEPGGIVAQLFPIPFLDERTFPRVIASFVEVFPESVLWYNTAELLLIGAPDALPRVDLTGLRQRMANETLQADLAYSYWGGERHWVNSPDALVAGFLCGPDGLRALAGDAAPLVDDVPVLAYETDVGKASERNDLVLIDRIDAALEAVGPLLAPGPDDARLARIAEHQRLNLNDLRAYTNLRVVEALGGSLDPSQAAGLLVEALEWNPHNFACSRELGDVMTTLGRTVQPAYLDEARRAYLRAIELRPDDRLARRSVALVLIELRRPRDAVTHLERALQIDATDALAHDYAGYAKRMMNDVRGAYEHFQEAVRLEPGDEQFRRHLTETARMLGLPQ